MAFKSRSFRGKILHVDVRKYYFDHPLVKEQFRKMQMDIRRYRHYALYLRRVARNSIRKVRAKPGGKAWRKPSIPGKPPRSRDQQHRLRWIEAAWDTRERAMLIGPKGLHKISGTTVPAIHEKSKVVIVKRNVYPAKKSRAISRRQAQSYKRGLRSGRIKSPQPTGSTSFAKKYPERPFMWPATKKTYKRFPSMWATGATLR